MSVYVCCVHCVCLCSLCLHMVANSQVLESATSTIMSGNSSHLGVCTTSLQSQQFQLFAPKLSQELGIDLSKAVHFSQRMKCCKKRSICDTPYTLYLPSLVISLPVAALSCDKVGLPTWPLTLNMMAKTNSKKCRHIHCSLSISTSLTFHGTNSNKKMKMAAKTHYQTNKYALQHEYSNLCKSFLGIRKSFNVAPNSQELKTENNNIDDEIWKLNLIIEQKIPLLSKGLKSYEWFISLTLDSSESQKQDGQSFEHMQREKQA